MICTGYRLLIVQQAVAPILDTAVRYVWTVLRTARKVRRWLQNKNNTRLNMICDSFTMISAFSLASVFYVGKYGRRSHLIVAAGSKGCRWCGAARLGHVVTSNEAPGLPRRGRAVKRPKPTLLRSFHCSTLVSAPSKASKGERMLAL